MDGIPQPGSQVLLDSLTVVPGVRWHHLSDPFSSALDELAEGFGIHPLQVEDCRHRRQTARLEEHDRYTFAVIKVLTPSPNKHLAALGDEAESGEDVASRESGGPPGMLPAVAQATGVPAVPRLRFEDFDIFLGPDYVLTVDEGHSRLAASVAPRIAAEAPLQNPDRVMHALIDAAVDQYLPALDDLGESIDRLEDRVIRHPSPATLRQIFRLKRELLEFRRVATAMREAVNGLLRRYDSRAATAYPQDRELRMYYRDVYDHIVRVIDLVETYRDLLTGSLDIYLSAVANRTNEVMKILTIWGTIALPLLILTSFYGMNVRLPFQEHPHVLALLAVTMGALVAGIVYYFRRRHWF